MRFKTLALFTAALTLTPLSAAPAQTAKTAEPAWQAAAKLKRGVNIIGYDPLWSDPAKARFQTKHFAIIKQGGFDFVRVVLQAFGHMDAQNRLNPRWLATLDRVVEDSPRPLRSDAVPYAVYLWTYFSSVLAHAAFFGRPSVAVVGAVVMGVVAVPLALRLAGQVRR